MITWIKVSVSLLYSTMVKERTALVTGAGQPGELWISISEVKELDIVDTLNLLTFPTVRLTAAKFGRFANVAIGINHLPVCIWFGIVGILTIEMLLETLVMSQTTFQRWYYQQYTMTLGMCQATFQDILWKPQKVVPEHL